MKTKEQLFIGAGALGTAVNLLSSLPSNYVNTVSGFREAITHMPEEEKKKNFGGGDDSVIQIKMDDYKNPVLYREGVRISTFIAFHDGKNILLFGRNENQLVENDGVDVFGAVNFNNGSLWTGNQKFSKITEHLFNANITEVTPVSDIVIEDNGEEKVVMVGWALKVSPEDLKAGVVDGKSFIQSIEDAAKRDDLVAKAGASVKELQNFLS